MLNKDQNKDKIPLRDYWILTAAFISIGSVLMILYLRGFHDFLDMKPSDWGDFLVGIFGPASFILLARGYVLQIVELRLQREELAANRKALLQQHEELEKSANQSKIQTEILQNQSNMQRWALIRQDLDAYIISIYRRKIGYFSGPRDNRIANPNLMDGEAPVWFENKMSLLHRDLDEHIHSAPQEKWKIILRFFEISLSRENEIEILIQVLLLYERRFEQFMAELIASAPLEEPQFRSSVYGAALREVRFVLESAPVEVVERARHFLAKHLL